MNKKELISNEFERLTKNFSDSRLTNHDDIVDFMFREFPQYDPAWNRDYILNVRIPMDVKRLFKKWVENR